MKSKYKILFLSALSWVACTNHSTLIPDDFDATKEVYAVLVEKALTEQADFDFKSWADMLAEDVEFVSPDQYSNKLVGKSNVIVYWKKWRESMHIKTLTFSGFNHAPFKSDKKLNFSGLSGVHVFSMFYGKWIFTNGKTAELRMNYCCRFNKNKLIDRCYLNYDRTPIIEATSSFPACVTPIIEGNILSKRIDLFH